MVAKAIEVNVMRPHGFRDHLQERLATIHICFSGILEADEYSVHGISQRGVHTQNSSVPNPIG
jgi:hypothetical protein